MKPIPDLRNPIYDPKWMGRSTFSVEEAGCEILGLSKCSAYSPRFCFHFPDDNPLGALREARHGVKRWSITLVLTAFGAITQANADMVSAVRPPMQCTPASCIDPSTGYYTQSTCDQDGCRQLGGIVGRVRRPGRAQTRVDGFVCNARRCIERSSGAVWESTCDYAGCRPLRPRHQ